MIMLGYFSVDDGEIIFASPKISPKTFIELQQTIQEILDVGKSNNLKFKFRLLGNEDFRNKVIEPVLSLSDEIADTSELFMRSIQLYNLFDKNKIPSIQTHTGISKATTTSDEIKIGQLVRTTFKRLFSQKSLDAEIINNLQDASYSKIIFGIQYPALKIIIPDEPTSNQRLDNKGRARYWSEEFNNGKYLLCNDWYEKHREKFLEWIGTLNISPQ